jgi:hypothetical protein
MQVRRLQSRRDGFVPTFVQMRYRFDGKLCPERCVRVQLA